MSVVAFHGNPYQATPSRHPRSVHTSQAMSAHRSAAVMDPAGTAQTAGTNQIDFENLGLSAGCASGEVGSVHALKFLVPRVEAKSGPCLQEQAAEPPAQPCGSACRLRVDRQAPFAIKHADENWLLMFGFCRGEVTGRALRMCQGPDSKTKQMAELIERAAGVLDSVTLYSKAGDDISVTIRAMPANDSDDASECVLEMYDGNAPVEFSKQGNEVPKAIMSAQAPFLVQQVNVAFLSYFGYTMPQVNAQGINIIFSANTDKYTWQHALQDGAAGEGQSIELVTRSADQCEITTTVQVTPILNAEGSVANLAVSFGEQGTTMKRSTSFGTLMDVGRAAEGGEFSRSNSTCSGTDSAASVEHACSLDSPPSIKLDSAAIKIEVMGSVKHHLDALKSMRQHRVC